MYPQCNINNSSYSALQPTVRDSGILFSTTSGKPLTMLCRKSIIFTTVQNLFFVLENDWAEFCTREQFPAFE